jgi:hypothetical protein
MNGTTERTCQGCGQVLGPMDVGRDVCMPCTQARHRAVLARRCVCGRFKRPRLVTNGTREWTSCDRCLGAIKTSN